MNIWIYHKTHTGNQTHRLEEHHGAHRSLPNREEGLCDDSRTSGVPNYEKGHHRYLHQAPGGPSSSGLEAVDGNTTPPLHQTLPFLIGELRRMGRSRRTGQDQ